MKQIDDLIAVSATSMMGRDGLGAIAEGLAGVSWTGTETIVEIGVYFGNTTVFMAKIMQLLGKAASRHICIDPFDRAQKEPLNGIGDRKAFSENISKHSVKVDVLSMRSDVAAHLVHPNIRFLSVDGSHLYENCASDLKLYMPKVLSGGIAFIDDYDLKNYPGVVRAVDEYLPAHPEFVEMRRGSFVLLRRS